MWSKFRSTLQHHWILWIAFGLLIVLAGSLRFYRLDKAPSSALIDEAHFGFIASSLAKTGRDEHGVAWPIVFRGFGDQKLPAYGYALVPVVKWAGLSVATIRVPSAIAGTMLVVVIFWLARSLQMSRVTSFGAAVLVAISPWTFVLSRFGLESNFGLLFFSVGLAALGKSVQSASKSRAQFVWGVVAVMSWAANWYSYIAYRPVTAVMLVIILGVLVVRRQLQRKQLLTLGLIFVFFTSPFLLTTASGSNTARLNQIGIWHDPGLVLIINEQRTFCAPLPKVLCYGLWNKPMQLSLTIAQRYLSVYGPQYLALLGDEKDQFLTVEGFGQMVVWLYPFFWIGVVSWLVKKDKHSWFGKMVLITGLLIAPLPAVLAGEPQKVRLSPLVPFVFLATAYGIHFVWQEMKKWQRPFWAWLLVILLGIAVSFSSIQFFVNFYFIHPVKNGFMYQSYVQRIWKNIEKYPDAEIYIKPFISDPILSYAFYSNFDPARYQKEVVLGPLEASGFQHAVQLGRVSTGEKSLFEVGCDALNRNQPSLYVSKIPAEKGILVSTIYSENGALEYAFVYDAKLSAQKNLGACPK